MFAAFQTFVVLVYGPGLLLMGGITLSGAVVLAALDLVTGLMRRYLL